MNSSITRVQTCACMITNISMEKKLTLFSVNLMWQHYTLMNHNLCCRCWCCPPGCCGQLTSPSCSSPHHDCRLISVCERRSRGDAHMERHMHQKHLINWEQGLRSMRKKEKMAPLEIWEDWSNILVPLMSVLSKKNHKVFILKHVWFNIYREREENVHSCGWLILLLLTNQCQKPFIIFFISCCFNEIWNIC